MTIKTASDLQEGDQIFAPYHKHDDYIIFVPSLVMCVTVIDSDGNIQIQYDTDYGWSKQVFAPNIPFLVDGA